MDWHTAKVTPAFKDAEKKVKAKPGKPSSLWMWMGMVEMDEKVLDKFAVKFSSLVAKERALFGNGMYRKKDIQGDGKHDDR